MLRAPDPFLTWYEMALGKESKVKWVDGLPKMANHSLSKWWWLNLGDLIRMESL
jgi:hypothetical protein